MSKMDNLRAMREAKYAEAQKRAGSAPARSRAAVPPAAPAAKKSAEKPAPAAAEPSASEELCGHRNMSGRTCTREAGHAAKSHRYS
ncbi:hypothetical protein ASG76_10665 [Nocardioides sp. Soil774]|uniref:hypothetical protein n=1 Tax=Nocardioides sp. Soil774 TaxID=1736408 RepID=UPI0006F61EAB|nr:hypothetical protein [Nocardioides sp. Soil774]KRE93878.1 hypothetical protein ASG76_10665 [Nocardioides sp. Soil774]